MMKIKTFVLVLNMALFISVTQLFAEQVADLTGRPLFVRSGFSESWTTTLPQADDNDWKHVPPSTTGNRTVRIKDLDLNDVPFRPFLSTGRYPDREFTLATSFMLRKAQLDRREILGMLLAAIGGNWEIYLNGHLVRREMHVRGDGSIGMWRAMRDVLIPLDPRILRAGENILVFRIVGDPTYNDTGLFQSSPFVIDDYEKLQADISELVPLILIFLYLFVGLYHLMLFLNNPPERYNFFYGLFSVCLFVYLFMRTHTVYAIIPDTDLVSHIEFISLFMLIPLLGAFFDLILEKKLDYVTIFYGGFCVLLAAATVPSPRTLSLDLLRIWQMSAIVPILYYFIIKIIFNFYRDLMKWYRQDRGGAGLSWFLKSLVNTLWRTVSGNLLIGVLVLSFTAVFDIIDSVYLDLDLVLTRYGFFVFVLGTTLILSNRFFFLHRKVRSLNEDLERKIHDLNQANAIISISEEKYRILIEGTNDYIFTLDDRWNLITANRPMVRELRINKEKLTEIRLMDLLYEAPEDEGMTRRLMLQKLVELSTERKPVNMKIKFMSPAASEPRDMRLRLEYIDIEGKNEIIGKATHMLEDSLLEYVQLEQQKYVIGNFFITAEEVSHRLVRNLVKFIDQKLVDLLRIGLREIIINAIEHGNLNITFDEKSEVTMSDHYMDFIMNRRLEPTYRDRKVTIEYSLTPKRVAYKIADDGSGFDHARILSKTASSVNDEMLAHGRGITMALNIFDEIKFNKRGNQVLLVKHFN